MVLVPVLWMISTAFKTEAQTYSPKPQWIPDPISLESFRKFFTTYNFGRMTLNSLVTCIFAMIICITCACLAGYGVTRFQFKGKKQLMNFLLVTQMFPSVMLVVPFYAVLSKYHMTNKLIGLLLCMQLPMWHSAHGCWFPTLRQCPLNWTRRPEWTGHPASVFLGTSYCP